MPGKDYANDTLVIHWNPQRCIHTGICTRLLPEVFDVRKRPWVTVDGADTQHVIDAVVACPTGALRYSRVDGGPAEKADEVTTVVPMRNGPLYVRGPIRVATPDGTVLAEETRVALCRCGASANAPFCDNSHRAMGFQSVDPPAVDEGQRDVEPASPADICEIQEF
jgi:uncharacterized Fe-S cluster protein YjdI/CDGSH-type Zn-finger protein